MKFNQPIIEKTLTENYAGGEAFTESPKLEIVSILLTSFVQDQFYRGKEEGMGRLIKLIEDLNDPEFVAKAILFARREFGMRSISHVGAVEIAKNVKGKCWTKRFFKRVIYRPDDMLEILARYTQLYGKPIPNAVKKGFRERLLGFDEYQVAKYAKKRAVWSLHDVVNLVHPADTPAIKKLMAGTLTPADTWETGQTQAGQAVADIEDGQEKAKKKAELKAENWKSLIDTGKLGYFALLRNLRNLAEQVDEGTLDSALDLLVDAKRIKKSLVLPFRFMTATYAIAYTPMNGKKQRKIQGAIAKALEISVDNIPELPGDTLVAIDVSGSMRRSYRITPFGREPVKLAALFGGACAKKMDADIILFDGHARYMNWGPDMSMGQVIKKIYLKATGGSTNFNDIFRVANRPYDRIVIFSDMQGWDNYNCPREDFKAYKKRFGCDTFVYSFDLEGYGSLQLPEANVFALAGFSDKVFSIMEVLEQDREALIHEIEKVEI